MRRYQQQPSCTSDHFPAEAVPSPAPATTFMHQRPPSRTSSYQLCSGVHLPAPAATSSAPATTFLLHQIPAATRPEPATTFLHQQLPVLNQRPHPCISRYQSRTSDHLFNDYQPCTSYPDLYQRLGPTPTITIRPWRLFTVRFSDFRFAIMKFGLSK